MATDNPTRLSTAEMHPGEQGAAEIRANSVPSVTDEEVRQLWDEGHLPVG